jgi:hypothetical protein
MSKNFDVSFSSMFFVLSSFRVFLSDESSKTLQKNVLQKGRVKSFYQTIAKKNPTFSRFVLPRLLGVSR